MEKLTKDQSSNQELQQRSVSLGTIGFLVEQDGKDSRQFRKAVVAAALLHVLAFIITWPTIAMPEPQRTEQVVRRIQVCTIIPPEPPPPIEMPKIPQRKTVALPDQTPDDPEPIRERIEVPEMPVSTMGIPDEIPAPPPPPEPENRVVYMDSPPRVVKRVQPEYTRPAILAKLEGAVVLKMVIDREGNVEEVTVLHGLALGLTDEAVRAASQWKFEPSIVGGKPVSVVFNLTVYFNLRS